MKYFTRELWAGFNTEDADEFRRTDETWRRNRDDYFRQLETLLPRLSKQARRFFTSEDLHDGRLLSFDVGDAPSFDFEAGERLDRNARKTGVSMRVLNYEQDALFVLRYAGLRRAMFDYPTGRPLFAKPGDAVGDWGYHELTAADDGHLRHEVLFSSGTTVLIEFKHFSYRRLRRRK